MALTSKFEIPFETYIKDILPWISKSGIRVQSGQWNMKAIMSRSHPRSYLIHLETSLKDEDQVLMILSWHQYLVAND